MGNKFIFPVMLLVSCLLLFSFYKKQKDNTLTRAEKKAGWQLLFDGKTLNGWRMFKNENADCWAVTEVLMPLLSHQDLRPE